MNDLSSYKRTIVTQDGEDGIIEVIFERLKVSGGWCVEFGAWDGEHLSNTWNLWHNRGWKALLIEGDPHKFEQLRANTRDFPAVACLCRWVSHEGPDRLDDLLEGAEVPKDFDLLSIDVDGDDYHIWKSLVRFEPKLVVIEYNQTFPPHIELIDPVGERNFGSSARATTNLARQKGYCVVCCTGTNLFFVRRDLLGLLEVPEADLEDAFPAERLAYLTSSMTGRAFLTGGDTFCSTGTLTGIAKQTLSLRMPESSHELHPVLVIDLRFLRRILPFLEPIVSFVRALHLGRKRLVRRIRGERMP